MTDITDPGAPRLLSPPAPRTLPRHARLHALHDLGYTLTPGHRYAVRVAASLAAHTGEQLAAPWMSVFDVGLPSPVAGLGTSGEMVVWEGANGPRVPVLSRSLLDVRTWTTAVAPPRLIEPPSPVRNRAPVVTAVPAPVDGSEQETLVDLSPALPPQGKGFVQLWVEHGREAPNTAGGVVVRPRPFTTSTLVQVTNIGLSVRGSGIALAILATRLDTGVPIPDAAITVLDSGHEVLWRGRTGVDGLAIARRADSARSDRTAAVVLAEKDGDASFVRTGYGWPQPRDSALAGVVMSDRGVYRPGETVEVKAWLALATPRGIEPVPAGTAVTLTWSSDGTKVRELAATVTAAGGAAWTLAVPPDAKVDGYQSLSVARTGVEHDGVEGTFAIKAVRPVEFTVTLGAELSAALDPPIVEARVQARDLSGIALAEAPVAWTVARATPRVLPARLLEDRAFSYAASDDETEEAIGEGRTPAPAAPDTSVLSLDRASYRPGDRARLTITSPVPDATALLTLERGSVLDARVVLLSGTTATVDLPVGDSAVAGLQAAVTLVHGRRSPCCDASRNDPGRPAAISAAIDVVLTRPRRSSQSPSRHRGTRDRVAAPRCGSESRTRRNDPCRARSPCGRWTRGCSR